MKLLLITDTHGKLSIINELIEKNNVDAVIHAGDFGFYDKNSYYELSERELDLHIIHSELNDAEKKQILDLSLDKKIENIIKCCPLSELDDYINNKKQFIKPIFVVWGNHEDHTVINRFLNGDYQIKNLNILHHETSFHLENFHIFGLGGNFISSKKLLQKPLSGGNGKIWSTFSQYTQLLKTVEKNRQENDISLFVSHVSPGKESFITLTGIHTKSDYIISGHMGPPVSMIWNSFAIDSLDQAISKIETSIDLIESKCKDIEGKLPSWFEEGISKFRKIPEELIHIGRGKKVPRWYRKLMNINLTDACNGYCVLTKKNKRISISTFCELKIN